MIILIDLPILSAVLKDMYQIITQMPYPCSQFCADVKFDITSDNRFDIKVGDCFQVNHTINYGTKLRSYGIV